MWADVAQSLKNVEFMV